MQTILRDYRVKPYIFRFAKYGRYVLKDFERDNLKGFVSTDYGDDSNNDEIGDSFYLIGYKRRVLLAYNTKNYEMDLKP